LTDRFPGESPFHPSRCMIYWEMLLRHLVRIAFPVPLAAATALLVATILSFPGHTASTSAVRFHKVTFLTAKASIEAEVADTDQLRARGLMFRTRLDKNRGMIFYFEHTGFHSFYMYNTRIPLCVIFLNEGLKIVDVQEMSPCLETNPSACPVYTPAAACKYAIEVNPEFVRSYGIKTGSLVRIQK